MTNTTMMPIVALSPHPLNQEIYGDPKEGDSFQELVTSIRMYGVLEPLIVTPDGVILNGRRRLEAAREVGLDEVPVRLVEGLDEAAQKELIVTLNHHRRRPASVMVREALLLAQLENGAAHKTSANGANGNPSAISQRIASRVGFSSRKTLQNAQSVLLSEDELLIELMDTRTVTSAYRKLLRQEARTEYSPVIKPSDNWNFSPVRYTRLDDGRSHGYIPGDLYANCFWYFVKPGDTVVDPMAGSGMAAHVYQRREEWMGEHTFDFELMLFDLTPQADGIKQHDLMTGFPTRKADYIFIDPPYLGMAKGVYSTKATDLANMDESGYCQALTTIARACSQAQPPGKLCTIVSPNYVDHRALKVINIVEYVRNCWREAGYRLYMEAYSSRRIQRTQHPTMAKMNNVAKERRLPLTDIAVVMTFERLDTELAKQ